MYLVELNGREKVIKSRAELQKWIRRGKITEYTIVKDVENKTKDYATKFLEQPAEQMAEDDKHLDFDPQLELENINSRILNTGYENFSQQELDELLFYYTKVKKYDREGLVQFNDVMLLRKNIGRIKKANIKKIAIKKAQNSKLDKVEKLLNNVRTPKPPVTAKQQYIRQDTQVVLPPLIPKPRNLPDIFDTRKKQPTKVSQQQSQEKIYHAKSVVIITLIIFPPLGIVLLWMSPKFSIISKIVLSFVIVNYIREFLKY